MGRLASQALAGRFGIIAGVDFVTAAGWRADVTSRLSDGEPSPWGGRALQLAVHQVLPELTEHPAILAQLHAGHQWSLAGRLAALLAAYAEHLPGQLARWLADPEEITAPEHLAWLPELAFRVAETLQFDPVEDLDRLRAEMPELGLPPTAVLLCPDLGTATTLLLDATLSDVPAFDLDETAVPGDITWLGSHWPARQAEVLRDELCRLFVADATLEPRDVLIVVPDVAQWWPALAAAFAPLPGGHPGRSLRLKRPAAAREPNPVLSVVAAVTRRSRAEASALIDLFAAAPLAHRWGLPGRDDLGELLAAAGVSWGLDAAHRAEHGLTGITQNTLARGLDRLLAGAALPPGSLGPIAAAEGVASTDLDLIGNLTELYSRLRRYTLEDSPATLSQWADRALQLISQTMSLPRGEEAMLAEATRRLAALTREAAGSPVELTAAEFARVAQDLARRPSGRADVGTGTLTVAAPEDLAGVGFRVVALLGIEDIAPATIPDALVDEEHQLPDPGARRRAAYLACARATQHLIVVHRHFNDATGQPIPPPAFLRALWQALDRDDLNRAGPTLSTATAHAEPNFETAASFDASALAGAERLRKRGRDSTCTARRRAALKLTPGPPPETLSVDEVTRFLKDPAAAFLRERSGIRGFEPATPDDDLPLAATGLQAWGIRSRILEAAREGRSPSDAARAEIRREVLPGGRLGRAALEAELELVGDLWRQARGDWERDVANIPIDVQVGPTTLTGTARLRGDELVVVTPSSLSSPLYEPWVQLLALATAGRRVRARVHYLHRDFGSYSPEVVTITPPEDPMAALTWLVRGAQLARWRLVPAPAGPAREFALAQRTGRFDPAAWHKDVANFDSPWAWRPSHWGQFYDGPADQLFADPAGEFDPPGGDEHGAFGRWALALHVPLLKATR